MNLPPRHQTCITQRVRPKRLSDFDYSGCHRYFITCCTWQRRLHFTKEVVELVEPLLRSSLRERNFDVLAWVFMPDHVHLLVQGLEPGACLRPAMTLARQRTAIAFRKNSGSPLWQDGYHERVLRKDDDTAQAIAYVLNNPVRAGIVSEWRHYPHSWAATLERLPRRW